MPPILAKCLAIFILFLSLARGAKAASDFTTDFESRYVLAESGQTSVTHTITLTNNLAHLYTTQYTIALGGGGLHNLQATDGTNKLPLTSSTSNNSTTLTVTLPSPQIGQGKSNTIVISYVSSDVATHIGNNWEVSIPRVARANEYQKYVRQVIIPRSIGPSTYTYPEPTHVDQGDLITYTYLGHTGDSLTLLFGKEQSYRLNLKYSIENTTLSQADTEIALPPNTSYQKVVLTSISPEPESMHLDQDGNWLAVYPLKGGELKTINAELYLTVTPLPEAKTLPPGSPSLGSDTVWQLTDPSIVAVSSELTTPRQIYDYLVNNFTYDYARVGGERLGAARALANPSEATCTEFTDAFIALARSKGIRAREVNGYAYGSSAGTRPQGEDILHAWPEYFDSKANQWLQVDPTWGNTTGGINYFDKLDYSHLAFIIHGAESSYPLPAGAYRRQAEESTIQVTPLTSLPPLTPHPLTPSLAPPVASVQPPSLWTRLLAFIQALF